ncbi:1107_t:CDS:2, partial [Rhizophagus irregularis]
HKPLFEYPKYLENYNDFEIDSAILRYCSGLSISYNKMCSDIIPIFHQSILRQSRNIKKLDISLDLFYEKIGQEFLRNIADVSLNLRQLIINFNQGSRRLLINPTTSNNLIDTTTWKKLYKIIQRQNKLKIFIIWNCFLLNNILSSLEFQKHSLVHIEFHNANFVNVNLKSLNNLNNLECLIFESCGGLLLNQCEILNFASFKLKELSLKHNKWDGDATLSIIKYLGEPLQKISVENITIPLIENISLYCPNLILLKIGIFPNNELYELEFYRKLANNVPINVSKISCFILKKFLNFKEFLENCHNNFEMINLNYNIELEFLKIVLDYIERSNNNLKTLGGIILDENFNEEELKLLNQIKDKGIKLVEFNSIHYI